MHFHFVTKEAMIAAALERSVADFHAREEERRANLSSAAQSSAFLADGRAAIDEEREFYTGRLALARGGSPIRQRRPCWRCKPTRR